MIVRDQFDRIFTMTKTRREPLGILRITANIIGVEEGLMEIVRTKIITSRNVAEVVNHVVNKRRKLLSFDYCDILQAEYELGISARRPPQPPTEEEIDIDVFPEHEWYHCYTDAPSIAAMNVAMVTIRRLQSVYNECWTFSIKLNEPAEIVLPPAPLDKPWQNPDLTEAQIDELKKALPKCAIASNPTNKGYEESK